MSNHSIDIHPSWKAALSKEFDMPYFNELRAFLKQEKQKEKTIFPKGNQIFNAYNSTPIENIKVVILGQDPYHGVGQAHGLCFSVPHGIKPPPSLVNIFKELHRSIPGFQIPTHGCLQDWTTQGVFLLNAILTVEAHQAASHQKKGWEQFTNATIQAISKQLEGVVFLLWGNFAQQKIGLIDENKHHILKTVHPSPLSAYQGFIGCGHFSTTNEILIKQNKTPINWQV
jgi:uracil-DNA glycosylase